MKSHLTDTIVARITNVEVPNPVEHEVGRGAEFHMGRVCKLAVPVILAAWGLVILVSIRCSDDAARADFANGIVDGVSNIFASIGVMRDAKRDADCAKREQVEACICRRPMVTCIACVRYRANYRGY